MLGRHHIALSVFTAAIFLIIFIKNDTMLIITLLSGVAIGSLVPDADSPDAAIFHQRVKGLKGPAGDIINAIVGMFLPAFGWVTKYLIYHPAIFIFGNTILKNYNIKEHHRGFLHSFIGIITATIMIGIYLLPVLLVLHAFTWWRLVLFLIAYLFSAFMHLIEDSCTVTGIQFNYPFSDVIIHGKLITRPDQAKIPDMFVVIMGIFAAAHIFLTPLLHLSQLVLAIISIFIIIASWTIFLKFVAQVEKTKGELKTYNNVKSLL